MTISVNDRYRTVVVLGVKIIKQTRRAVKAEEKSENAVHEHNQSMLEDHAINMLYMNIIREGKRKIT